MLSDKQIRDLSCRFDLISPFDEDNLQPSSYDLTLASSFIVQDSGMIDPFNGRSEDVCVTTLDEDKFLLHSGQFVLASTNETVKVPNYLAGRFEGKSSLGRIGLCTHVTAGFIDPGFNGTITVELVNLGKSDILLTKGMKIGQICFYRMDDIPEHSYGYKSHYQNQSGVKTSWYMSN